MWQHKAAQSLSVWAFAAAWPYRQRLLRQPVETGFPVVLAAADEPTGDDANANDPRDGTTSRRAALRGARRAVRRRDENRQAAGAPQPDGAARLLRSATAAGAGRLSSVIQFELYGAALGFAAAAFVAGCPACRLEQPAFPSAPAGLRGVIFFFAALGFGGGDLGFQRLVAGDDRASGAAAAIAAIPGDDAARGPM